MLLGLSTTTGPDCVVEAFFGVLFLVSSSIAAPDMIMDMALLNFFSNGSSFV